MKRKQKPLVLGPLFGAAPVGNSVSSTVELLGNKSRAQGTTTALGAAGLTGKSSGSGSVVNLQARQEREETKRDSRGGRDKAVKRSVERQKGGVSGGRGGSGLRNQLEMIIASKHGGKVKINKVTEKK